MNANVPRAATFKESDNTARIEPVRSPLLVQSDPRLEASADALVLASRNAFPIVANQKATRGNFTVAAGGALALVLGLATFMSLSSTREASTASPAPKADQPGYVLPPASAHENPISIQAPAASQPATSPFGAPAPAPQTLPDGVRVSPPLTGSSPVLVFDGGAPPAAAAQSQTTPRGAEGATGMLAVGGVGRESASDNSAARSSRLAEPSSTVIQGTLIPAVLETAIDTDVPGYVRAVVSQDVRSFDGRRLLIPKSSRLVGEYKGVTQAGQRRAYLMWTRLIRPDGVSIALASPAADFSGQAGVSGQVNSHFFSRFGSAILLSILGGAGTFATGGASTVVVSGGQSAASIAAQRDSSRMPTIKVRQGEPIRVFTARDLIFSDGENA